MSQQLGPAAKRSGALTVERIALLRLHQRNMALDEPDPMVPVTSADLLALLDAAEAQARGEAAAVTHDREPAPYNSDADVSDALDALWDAICGKSLPPGAARKALSLLERAVVELWYRRGWKGPEQLLNLRGGDFWTGVERIREQRVARILGCDAAAIARLGELEPEAHRVFGARPLEVDVPGAHPAVTLAEVQGWYRERGLLVSMKIVGDQMVYDFVGLVEPIYEEQPDGQTRVRVR